MKRILAFLLLASPLMGQAPTITQDLASQTVLAGASATFTLVSSVSCRSLWFIQGVGRYGPVGTVFTYVIPITTDAQNNTSVQLELYGCSNGSPSVYSKKAVLTVTAVPPPIVLAVTGNLLFDDSTTVYVGNITIQQFDGVGWVSAGSVASDAGGLLSGNLSINPILTNADGMIELQYQIPGATPTAPPLASISNQMPLDEITQGSTGVVFEMVLFKQVFMNKLLAVAKSSSFQLTP